jgi:hypothetical protein
MLEVEWHLLLGSALVATIQTTDVDFPWTYGDLVDSARFHKYRVYFSDEDDWPETDEFASLCSEIRDSGSFSLLNTATQQTFRSFRLNHEANIVWFQYS